MTRNPRVTKNRVQKLLIETSLGYKQIGAIVGVTKQRVAQIAQKIGVRYQGQFLVQLAKKRRGTETLAKRVAFKKAKIEKRMELITRLRHLVEVEGYSFTKVAPLLNTSDSEIMRLAKKYGIKSQHRSINPKYK